MSRRIVVFLLVPFLVAGCAGRGEEPRSWSVILISVDTLRPDHLSCYGTPEVRTPGIDRLASGGVLFEDAATVAPTTLPAHASLLTGTSPPRHGVRDNIGFYLSPGTETLASALKGRGYETAAFVGAFVLDARFGLDQGFDFYDDDLGAAADGMDLGLVAQRDGASVLGSALQWLDGRGDAPFFAFLHFYDPHTPYEPRPGFSAGPDDEGRYRGEVVYVDSLVGRLLDWLDTSAHREKTIVVLTSDHGESLGEHGELTHGYFLYQSTLRIPLIVRYPGSRPGTRAKGLARIIDVAPTVLDLLRLPPLGEAEGESLLPLLRGEALPRSSYAETYVPRLHYGWSELRSLRQGDRKLIVAPRPELYDLASDPDETRNLIDSEPAVVRRMRADLERRLEEHDSPVSATPLDEESLQKLEALGYAGGSLGSSPRSRADPKDRLDVYLAVNDPGLDSVDPSQVAEFDETLRLLRAMIARDPTIPRVYVLLGDLLVKGGRFAEAARVFETLVEIEPESFLGHYGLGVARARLGNLEAAVESFEHASSLEPRNTKPHLQLAEAESARGNWHAAESWLRKALAIHPDPVLESRLVQVLFAAGKHDEARDRFSRMDRKDRDAADATYELGQLLLLGGDAEGAAIELRRAISADPGDAKLHLALGNALSRASRPQEAVVSFEEAIRLSPCLAQAHGNLGSTYAQLGRLSEAARSLEKAVACDPGYAVAYRNLAAVRLETKDIAGAVEAMRKAVAASPGDEELRKTLRDLEAYQRSR